jgi:hypothetical protein
MEQKPLFDNGVQVEKYHHKEGLVLTFLAVVSGKQVSMLLDKQHTLEVRDRILAHYPTDEVQRLRIAMTCIAGLAKRIGTDTPSVFINEITGAILETASSWPQLAAVAVDLAAKDDEIAQLKKQVRDMQDAAAQLKGIEAWIADKDMKRHCSNTLDKLTK